MSSELPAPELRASHEDRDRVVETLRVAAGDGRLTAEELEARLEAALTARTLGELAALATDLPQAPPRTPAPRDLLVVEQISGKYVLNGSWVVPRRIELRPSMCDVTLDFTEAVIAADTLRIEMKMSLGKLYLVTAPGIVIDTAELKRVYAKLKLDSPGGGGAAGAGAAPRLRIELAGVLTHGKVIERAPRRRRRELPR